VDLPVVSSQYELLNRESSLKGKAQCGGPPCSN